jgi:hypothetical protein
MFAVSNESRVNGNPDSKFIEENEGKLCIVMEIADSGDLESKI